jgi:hypothetical protein
MPTRQLLESVARMPREPMACRALFETPVGAERHVFLTEMNPAQVG